MGAKSLNLAKALTFFGRFHETQTFMKAQHRSYREPHISRPSRITAKYGHCHSRNEHHVRRWLVAETCSQLPPRIDGIVLQIDEYITHPTSLLKQYPSPKHFPITSHKLFHTKNPPHSIHTKCSPTPPTKVTKTTKRKKNTRNNLPPATEPPS